MDEDFANLGGDTDIQIHDCQRTTNNINIKKITQRHNIIKLSKVEKKDNFETVRVKWFLTYERMAIKLWADFYTEPL